MDDYVVYIHTNLINGKKYVGITKQSVNRRWRNGNGYYQNTHFYRAIQRDGWDNFTHEIIKAGLNKKEACRLETELIAKYKTNDEHYGYNKSSGGENPNSGVTMSAETRQKMSETKKGRHFSETHKQNMSIAAKKRGNNLNGRFGIESQTAGLVKQIDISTGEIVAEFFGFNEMNRKTGFGIVPVRRATNGKQKQSHGFKWEYIPRRKLNVAVRQNI